jgi:hypothetical protein
LFLQANSLVTRHPDAIEDWKTHFWEVRRWFFGSNMILVGGLLLRSLYSPVDETAPGLRFAPLAAALFLSAVGYVSSSERVQGGIAVAATLIILLTFAGMETVA